MLVQVERLVLSSDERTTPQFSLQKAWDIFLCHLGERSCYANGEWSPIVTRSDYTVIDGFRRVIAAQRLSLEYIEVTVVDESPPVHLVSDCDSKQHLPTDGSPSGSPPESSADYEEEWSSSTYAEVTEAN